MQRSQEVNKQNTIYNSATGRRYERQYTTYMNCRPMPYSGTSVDSSSSANRKNSEIKNLNQSQTTVASVALEYAALDESGSSMKRKESKISGRGMSEASNSGSSISSHLRGTEKKEKLQPRGKKVPQSRTRSRKGLTDASVEDGVKIKSRKSRTVGETHEGACPQKHGGGAHGSDRDWNVEGGKPKGARKSSPKQNAGDSADAQRQSKRQVRRKRAVSSSDKLEQSKQVRHGVKPLSSGSGASASTVPTTRQKSKTQKDSPRSTSSAPDSRNPKSSRGSKRSSKDGPSKSSKGKAHSDNQGTAPSIPKSSSKKKTGKAKSRGSECRSRKRRPVVDSVASLPTLYDSSDSESDEDVVVRRTAPTRPRTRTQTSYPEQGPSMQQAQGSAVQNMMATVFSCMVNRFGSAHFVDSEDSIDSDQLPDLLYPGYISSSSSDSSDQNSDTDHESMPSLTSYTDSDLSELSSGSHGGGNHGETSMESASWFPPLISDSNSEDSEYTAEDMSDMEEDDELYRAADEFHDDIEDAFFPFIQLPPPSNPLEMIIHNRLHHTQEVMQTLFENAILHMLALHPDLQGDQAPPPATQDVIDDLPQVRISQKQLADELTCAICQCEYKLSESVNKLPCDHLFHPMCITAWLQKSGTCPVCRHVLGPDG